MSKKFDKAPFMNLVDNVFARLASSPARKPEPRINTIPSALVAFASSRVDPWRIAANTRKPSRKRKLPVLFRPVFMVFAESQQSAVRSQRQNAKSHFAADADS